MKQKLGLWIGLFMVVSLQAQQRFHNYIYAAPLFSHATRIVQQGPGVVGKLGLEGGIGTIYDLKNGNYWSFSLTYAERGARKRRIQDNNAVAPDLANFDYHLRLRYISVPILYGLPSQGFNIQLGPSINFLLSDQQITSDNLPPNEIIYREIEYMVHCNLEFEINDNLFFNLRLYHSINTINITGIEGVGFWYQRGSMHRGLGVGLSYYFTPPNFKINPNKKENIELND
jgi:hypothetical protein